MSSPSAIIYGAEWCGYCHVAQEYLDKKGVTTIYKDIDEDRAAAVEAFSKSGQNAIPVIDISGTIIVGFDIAKINAALAQQ